MSKSRLSSGKIKKLYGDKLTVDRYDYLDPSQAEPDLGLPLLDGSILIGSTSSNIRTWSQMVTVDTTGTVTIFSTASDRYSYNTNALQILGGVSIAKNLHVGGIAYLNGAEVLTTQSGLSSVLGDSIINQTLKVNTTTNATSTTTGALQVIGGAGIGGTLFVGGLASTSTSFVVYYNTTTGELSYNEATGGGGGNGGVGSPFAGIFTITNTTTAISTLTGALQVAGGVGIQGDLFVGGTAYLNNAEVLTTSSRITSVEGLTQVTQDFVVNTTTNSTSTTDGALQVRGGVGIAKDVRIGQNLYVNGSVFLGDAQVLTTASGLSSTLGQTEISQNLFVNTNTNSISTSDGALRVLGGVGIGLDVNIGGKVRIESTLNSTSTIGTNALYVAGGVGIEKSLLVTGEAVFLNNVVFAGTSTYIYSTNTVYTDNLINVHVPIGSTGTEHNWAVDDGKDIGFVYHYYKGQDKNAFLGLDNSSGYLEWYSNGEETGGIFTGTEYGLFKTGALILASTTASSSSSTGALVVAGGVGIGGNLYIGGALTVAGSSVITADDLLTITYPAAYITNDPTEFAGLPAIAGTSTAYGSYNFGTVLDIRTFNDYNTATSSGYYSINDAATTPGYIVYVGFENIVEFNRIVLNINYTPNSNHTINIDIYNHDTSAWDTFAIFSGLPGWYQLALGLIDSQPYISGGNVTLRLHHISGGSPSHRTWIDYVALEKSKQGGQGPRGAQGPTGPQGTAGTTTSTTSTFVFFNTTTATSTISAAVVAYGGMGIGGGLYVRGDINYSGNIYQNGSVIGARGYDGSVGYTGSAGYAGSVGYAGSRGAAGFTGSQGETGFTGSQGPAGSAGTGGAAGATGFTGSIGYTGSKGDIGFTGPIGYTGSGGYTGSAGLDGYTGSKGEKGDNATGGASTVLERHYRKPGVLTVNTGTEKWYVPVDSTITSIKSRVEVAPQGAVPLTVAIKINNISTATLNINSATTVSLLNTSTINIRSNDFVTVDVLNIGNTVAGSDLTVTFTYIRNI
jgi:hypothetical protein